MTEPVSASLRRNVSAFERLRELPAVFRGSDLTVRLQWDSKKTSHYLWLWKNRNLVQALGGHSDVFANMVVEMKPNWESALVLARPSAVIVGIECLRRAGWTTQIPRAPDVAISTVLPVFASEHFVVSQRLPGWFIEVASGASEGSKHLARALRPAWALADMLAREGWSGCGLGPDDIDWNLVEESDCQDWAAAEEALDIPAGAAAEVQLRVRGTCSSHQRM